MARFYKDDRRERADALSRLNKFRLHIYKLIYLLHLELTRIELVVRHMKGYIMQVVFKLTPAQIEGLAK